MKSLMLWTAAEEFQVRLRQLLHDHLPMREEPPANFHRTLFLKWGASMK